ncbi:DUF5011 domain-containing protein [Candidatus Saccharibacteria bacterium]|nr:DUF5011 domain-containing protein [Candidatus Saccharibacteria bacterium]
MVKHKILGIILGLLVTIVAFETSAIVIISILKNNLVFELQGQENIVLELEEPYEEPGYTAYTTNTDLSERVQVDNTVDVSIIGEYDIIYTLIFLNQTHQLHRHVEVIDTTPPTIALNGDNEVRLYMDDEYTEAGAAAHDNYDGDITDYIKIDSTLDTSNEGEYEIVYAITDSSGNSASITRRVIVEKKPEPVVVYTPPQANTTYYAWDTSADDTEVPAASGDPIADYIASRDYDVSVGYYNLATGRQYFYRGDVLYYGASLIKTLDAIYMYEHDMVNGDTKPYVDRAISISDNSAHAYLVDYIGREALRQYGISIGAPNTLSYEGSIYGDTTVMDQLAYYKKAYEIASVNGDFKAPFVNESYNHIKIGGLTTMHKFGYYDQWCHDAGIVFADEPYIVVILTNHGKWNGRDVLRDLASVVYQYHTWQI